MNQKNEKILINISFPLPEEKIFRSGSVPKILELLINNPHQEFSISQLEEITNKGTSGIHRGIDILEALDLIKKRKAGKKILISINRERVDKPNDPIFAIPQDNFRDPIRKIKQEIINNIDYVAGVLVFGSVARGEADRASDIDLLVLVEDNLTSARRKTSELVSELQTREINGERYEFEVLVESDESAKKRGDNIRNIFSEGIVIHNSKTLEKLKEDIFNDK